MHLLTNLFAEQLPAALYHQFAIFSISLTREMLTYKPPTPWKEHVVPSWFETEKVLNHDSYTKMFPSASHFSSTGFTEQTFL